MTASSLLGQYLLAPRAADVHTDVLLFAFSCVTTGNDRTEGNGDASSNRLWAWIIVSWITCKTSLSVRISRESATLSDCMPSRSRVPICALRFGSSSSWRPADIE